MKTKYEDEKTTRSTVPFPVVLWDKVKKEAKRHRRSANDELIFILEEYFDGSLIKLDRTNREAVEMYAKAKDFTIAAATNYLVSTRISVTEWVQDIAIGKANKEYDTEFSERKKENAM
jgi:hypothetical protein